MDAIETIMKTIIPVIITSFLFGQETLLISCRTCLKNSIGDVFCIFSSNVMLAGVEGLEPPAPGFGDRCSGQLSYTPKIFIPPFFFQEGRSLLSTVVT